MSTLLEKARGHDLRAVQAFGHDDHYLVWERPTHDVCDVTVDSCSCVRPALLWGVCVHQEFVRRLVECGIPAVDPVSATTMEAAKLGTRRRRDTPTHRHRQQPTDKGGGQQKFPRVPRGVYRGVVHNRRLKSRPWNAFVYIHGRKTYLGGYEDPETAAMAYDWAAHHVHGDEARLNFPADMSPMPPPGIPESAFEAIASLMIEEAS